MTTEASRTVDQQPSRLFVPGGAVARWDAHLLSRPLSLARTQAAQHVEALTVGALLLAALLHLLRVYNRGFNLLDEGFVLHVAERVLQGQVPYRDFFTQLTPGAFVALAGVFALTGPSVIVGRWVTVALGLAITLLLYRGGRHIASRPVAAFAALGFPIWGIAQGWFYPNYSWFALAAATGALLCLLRGLAERRSEVRSPKSEVRGLLRTSDFGPRMWWCVAAGLLCSVAAFCKQNVGLYALVSLVAAWLIVAPDGWHGRWAGAVALIGAAVPLPLAFIAWLAAHGALADFYRDAVWIPLAVFPKEMAAPYPPFWPPWPLPTDPKGQGAWIFRLVCLLPPLPYGVGVLYLATSAVQALRSAHPPAGETRPPLAAFVAWLSFGGAIWATAFPRADFDHVQVALGTAFVVGGALLERFGCFLVHRRVWRLWGASDDRTKNEERRTKNCTTSPFFVLRSSFFVFDGVWCRRWLPQTIACVLLGGFLIAGLGHARALHMGPGWSLRGIGGSAPRASGILLDHDDAAELNRLIGNVRRLSAPGEPIAAVPWNAGLYFLAERRNATRFDLIIPASVLPDDLPELERDLGHARLVVYWTARDAFIDNTSLDDRIPDLDKYIVSRYRAVGAVNAYRLLVRD